MPPRLWPPLIALLAGSVAELRILGNARPDAERTDRQQVLDALQATMRPSERAIEALVSYITIEAEDFVNANFGTIDRGAQILLERGRLTRREFRRRLADA